MPKHSIFDKLSDKKKNPFEDSPSGFKIRFEPYSDALRFFSLKKKSSREMKPHNIVK